MEEDLWKIVSISSSLYFLYFLYGLYRKYNSWYDGLFIIFRIFTPNPRKDNGIKILLFIAFILIVINICEG